MQVMKKKRGTLTSYSSREAIEEQSARKLSRNVVIQDSGSEWDLGGTQTRGISRGQFVNSSLRAERLPVLNSAELGSEAMQRTKVKTYNRMTARWEYK